MIFTRTGPGFLFLRSLNGEQLKDYLINRLQGQESSLYNAFEHSGENSTIVFITLPGAEKTIVEDALFIILIPFPSCMILSSIISDSKAFLVEKCHLGPGLLIMRVPRENKKIIERISQEYKAAHLSLEQAVDAGEAGDTILTFVDRPINRIVPTEDFVYPFLLINKPLDKVHRNLRRDAIRYITEGLENTQWYELRINIYDGDGHYMRHVERLTLAFSDLEVGLVLGETWTRDHAMTLFSVVAYQIRLFTLLPPEEIKRLLVGLEYTKDGRRFVDMDLYYRNRKIEWFRVDELKKMGRISGGMNLREYILSRLTPDTRDRILEIEEEIRRENLEIEKKLREKLKKK